jgi:large subunit ribosomal protein L3
MTIGVIGRKAGMTRIFNEDGASIPVTVIEISPNRITQLKDADSDGYRAVQLAAGERRASRVSKPMAGHYAKAGVEAGSALREFRLEDGEGADLATGGSIDVTIFETGQQVDVRGVTKGRGFAGASAAITSAARTAPTVTRCPTVRPARSVNAKRRAVFSKASAWPVRWATSTAASRI